MGRAVFSRGPRRCTQRSSYGSPLNFPLIWSRASEAPREKLCASIASFCLAVTRARCSATAVAIVELDEKTKHFHRFVLLGISRVKEAATFRVDLSVETVVNRRLSYIVQTCQEPELIEWDA